jgi:hypothetical protein
MGGAQPDVISSLETLAAPLAAHTQPSVLTRIAPAISVEAARPDVTRSIRAYLMYRDAEEKNLLRTVRTPRDGEVLAPEWTNPPRGNLADRVLDLDR